jgi:hypothetical protein
VELDPVDEGVVVDRPAVGGAAAEALEVALPGSLHVLGGDGGERHQLDVVDLDPHGTARVGAADLDLGFATSVGTRR